MKAPDAAARVPSSLRDPFSCVIINPLVYASKKLRLRVQPGTGTRDNGPTEVPTRCVAAPRSFTACTKAVIPERITGTEPFDCLQKSAILTRVKVSRP